MSIQAYFWTALAVLVLVIAGVFAIAFAIGSRRVDNRAGLGVGIAIVVVLIVVYGGAKRLAVSYGPTIEYEGAWLASALNLALVGGYIGGKRRAPGDKAGRALSALCAALSLTGVFLMAAKLQPLIGILQTLGVGKPHVKPAGPDTTLGCSQSLAKIYEGFEHYAELYGALPPADKWMDEEDLKNQVQTDAWFHCPSISTRSDDKYGYAFNDTLARRKLNGKPLKKIPDAARTPLVYDSTTLTKNAHDPVTSLPRPGRHGGRNNILYCDGHIEAVAPK